MLNVKFITLGTLKEAYLRDAAAEYEKRLGGFCRFESIQLKEERLSDDPSDNEIKSALEKEGDKILSLIPARAYVVAMCVEGKQLSSPELADKLDEISARTSDICFIIGSSFGLSDTVKQRADLKLSVSKLTFPHQLMRVILLEAVYRAFNIQKGTKYHK
ncbi:MAG: 23S rRNA (pseudouridine(1915)-N(3))-methyltransferase RlmH [Ruminococcaceae bacterium]|nr:23S rRNA (pseudouridine(1915)-N(3))-methyltransferase RlmH [Oscillospiraceae bacterium]